ncbi:hypothetical protein ABI59_19805 [Acidobacteria bacterium Mor1]|nr:hypothetical protein ABI59_19805 [Acidobacteria bacterium Mor1]
MSPAKLAWRSLTRQPARAVLGVAGVVAVGALLFDMLLLSRGLVLSFEDFLDDLGFDVRVTATTALPGNGPKLQDVAGVAADLRELPEIANVSPIRLGWVQVRGETTERMRREAGIDPEAAPQYLDYDGVTFVGTYTDGRRSWSVVEGDPLPATAERPTVVINRNLADLLELGPGDTLSARGKQQARNALPLREFYIAGIADFPFNARDSLTVATHLDTFFETYGTVDEDSADFLMVESAADASSEAAVAAIERARPDIVAISNAYLVQRFQGTEFSYFRQVSFVLTTITLFFAFLLVTTLLSVSVNQRFGEIAGLRAIGFSRGRVILDLLFESFLLIAMGGVLALPVGWLTAQWLDSILRQMPGLPLGLHFFVFEPRAVVIYTVLLTLTGILAAVYPVFLAARLPIAATLRDEVL